MKNKKYILYFFVIILGLLFFSYYIYSTFFHYDREAHYLGEAHVFFKPETNISTIINISINENLTILNIQNKTNEYNEIISIRVIYYAPTWNDGKNVYKKLEKYEEVKSIALMGLA